MSVPSCPWGKAFLVNTLACWGSMWQWKKSISFPKSVYSLKTFWNCFWWLAVLPCEITFLNHSVNGNVFLTFYCWNVTYMVPPGLQVFCGSSEPSTKPQKQTQKENYPMRGSVDYVLKISVTLSSSVMSGNKSCSPSLYTSSHSPVISICFVCSQFAVSAQHIVGAQ